MPKYTIEIYKPAYTGNLSSPHVKMAVHRGSFEDVRDSLSPCMVTCKEVRATQQEARKLGKRLLEDYRLYRHRYAHY